MEKRMDQERQHEAERKGEELLRRRYGDGYVRAGHEQDVYNGIDCYINGKPFDMKASESGCLSVFRHTKNRGWYCPLVAHPDVDYLYVKGGTAYYIDRGMLLSNFAQLAPKLRWGTYNGDGNYQAWVDLSPVIKDLSYREVPLN